MRERQVVCQPSTNIVDEDVIFHATEAAPQLIVVGSLVDAEVDEKVELADHQLGGTVMGIHTQRQNRHPLPLQLLAQPLQRHSMTSAVGEACRQQTNNRHVT